jgi:hypothetical protein
MGIVSRVLQIGQTRPSILNMTLTVVTLYVAKNSGLLRVVAPSIVKLGRAQIAMPGGAVILAPRGGSPS